MAPRTTRPGLRALDPTTPIGHTSWGPILPIAGGRAGGSRGVDILVGDDDGDDPDFDDDDEGDEDDEDDEGTRAEERQRAQDRRDAARGWQRPKKGQRDQRDDEDDDEEDDQLDDETADERPTRRTRGKRGSADDTEEWTPPTRDQWESVTAAVKRNNDENLKRRYVAKAMKRLGIEDEDGFRDFMISRGLDPDSGEHLGGYDGAQDDGPNLFDQSEEPDGGRDDEREQDPRPTRAQIIAERRRAEERGAARAASKYKDGVALFAAEAALREAGWNGRDLDLALRLVDLDGVEVDFDDHGRPVVYNIDEQVKRIKEDVPEWFRPRRAPRDDDTEGRAERSRRDRPARRAGGARAVDGGERGRSGGRPQTWLERADAQMMGRGRR